MIWPACSWKSAMIRSFQAASSGRCMRGAPSAGRLRPFALSIVVKPDLPGWSGPPLRGRPMPRLHARPPLLEGGSRRPVVLRRSTVETRPLDQEFCTFGTRPRCSRSRSCARTHGGSHEATINSRHPRSPGGRGGYHGLRFAATPRNCQRRLRGRHLSDAGTPRLPGSCRRVRRLGPSLGTERLSRLDQHLLGPASGTKSIDLAGREPGAISQTIETTVGKTYA